MARATEVIRCFPQFSGVIHPGVVVGQISHHSFIDCFVRASNDNSRSLFQKNPINRIRSGWQRARIREVSAGVDYRMCHVSRLVQVLLSLANTRLPVTQPLIKEKISDGYW